MITKLYCEEKELTKFPCRGTLFQRVCGADYYKEEIIETDTGCGR